MNIHFVSFITAEKRSIANIKVTNNISYYEARETFESVSYANVVKTNNGMDKDNGVNDTCTKVTEGNISVGSSTSTDRQNKVNETEMECGTVGNNKKEDTVEKEDIDLISIIINLTKIINRNPGKITIQARHISNLIYKRTKHKLEVCDVVKALQ